VEAGPGARLRLRRPLEPIYHIARESEWRAGQGADGYAPPGLSREGFVHCASREAVLPVAADYFSQASEPLLLLELDPAALGDALRFEPPAPLPGGGRAHLQSARLFPHVYGPLARAAIRRIGVLRRVEGGFAWPGEWRTAEGVGGARPATGGTA